MISWNLDRLEQAVQTNERLEMEDVWRMDDDDDD